MSRVIAAVFLAATGLWPSAEACSLAPFDPSDEKWTVEQIIDGLPEVVLEGEIIERDPILGDFQGDGRIKEAKLHVDQAWKGKAGPVVVLKFNEDSSACGAPPPPVGTHLRIEVSPISENVFDYGVTSDLLLRGPKLEQALREYQQRTNAMEARAESGGHAEQIAFAEYLKRYGETHRALDLYQSILRKHAEDLDSYLALATLQGETGSIDDARATLARIRLLTPRNEEWRGKLARTTFLATGVLSSSWKNWSKIENAVPCHVAGSDFDSANFDGARLHSCLFQDDAHFHGASFKGADLEDSDFLVHADVKGAFYDCATRLPEWIDPAAAGMINVAGSCNQP